MTANLTALKAAIKLVADAAVDTEKVIAAGSSPLAALFAYKNLIGDVLALVPQIGEIPTEAKAMVPADYVTLVAEFAKDAGLSEANAGTVVNAGIDLLQELVGVVLPKVEALANAVKKSPAAPAVAAPAAS